MVFELSLIFTLPLSSLIRLVGGWVFKLLPSRGKPISSESSGSVDLGRRKALGAIAAAVPLGTLAMGAGGFGQALAGVKVYEKQIPIVGLPSDLERLKILHLSDLHLGPFVKLDDLEQVMSKAEKHTPDLVLVTGDIADNVSILGDALKLIDQIKPRLGSFASFGNHEHYRGLEVITRIIESSPVQLLVDEGVPLTSGAASLYVAGINDPRGMRGDHTAFFQSALDKALLNAGSDDTLILMSHRPEAFDIAASQGVHLTLAGHTHGTQVGLMGRSIFEGHISMPYLWGQYTKGNSQLYTSAGVGHWFPFRLGCPSEAPIITLVS